MTAVDRLTDAVQPLEGTAAPLEPIRLYTTAQVAQVLQISEASVRRWVALGDLPCYRFGRSVRVSLSDLTQYIDECRDNGWAA